MQDFLLQKVFLVQEKDEWGIFKPRVLDEGLKQSQALLQPILAGREGRHRVRNTITKTKYASIHPSNFESAYPHKRSQATKYADQIVTKPKRQNKNKNKNKKGGLKITCLGLSSPTQSYSLRAARKMMAMALSMQWIHFLLSARWPPTSTILHINQHLMFKRFLWLFFFFLSFVFIYFVIGPVLFVDSIIFSFFFNSHANI